MKKEKLDILYEDKFLIAVNKKSGLLTIANDKEKEKTLYHEVHDYLWKKNKNNKVFIIHRLDKDTSGIVLFAKNEKIKKVMQENWENVQRYYYALVHGKLESKRGTIINYLKETSTFKVYISKDKTGEKAITKYNLVNTFNNISLLEINILTGKKNQIRVALSDIKHPILGDKKYGIKDGMRLLCLHAYKMIFVHPITKKEIVLISKLPKYMNLQKK